VRFWDASALVPLVLVEPFTRRMAALLRDDPAVIVWWDTVLECEAALRRRERDGSVRPGDASAARARLSRFREEWTEVQPSGELRTSALRLLAVHPLRSADALQLAAALQASGPDRSTLPLVCLDRRLSEAALREGMDVVTVG
jgi:predicted nucleic acid-binding protein